MIVIQFIEPLTGTANTVYITTSPRGNVNITDEYGYVEIRTLIHAGKIVGNERPEIHELYKTESEVRDAVIGYLNSIDREYEIVTKMTVTVVVFGDAPTEMSFEEETEPQRFIKRVNSLFEKTLDNIRKEANSLFPLKFTIRERGVTGDKKGHDAFVLATMEKEGISKGPNFIKTPIGRIEWSYLGTDMGNPNNADTDRSRYEFLISEYSV